MADFRHWVVQGVLEASGFDITCGIENLPTLQRKVGKKAVAELLNWACSPQNTALICIGREYLTTLPPQWCKSVIIEVINDNAIELDDDWYYRRFLELTKLIDTELLQYGISIGLRSKNLDIVEAANDYLD